MTTTGVSIDAQVNAKQTAPRSWSALCPALMSSSLVLYPTLGRTGQANQAGCAGELQHPRCRGAGSRRGCAGTHPARCHSVLVGWARPRADDRGLRGSRRGAAGGGGGGDRWCRGVTGPVVVVRHGDGGRGDAHRRSPSDPRWAVVVGRSADCGWPGSAGRGTVGQWRAAAQRAGRNPGGGHPAGWCDGRHVVGRAHRAGRVGRQARGVRGGVGSGVPPAGRRVGGVPPRRGSYPDPAAGCHPHRGPGDVARCVRGPVAGRRQPGLCGGGAGLRPGRVAGPCRPWRWWWSPSWWPGAVGGSAVSVGADDRGPARVPDVP